MNRDATTLWIEEVLQHRDYLQRLARQLLGSEDLADDLFQATVERAVSRPPRRQDNIRGWLATVMIHLKTAWIRSEVRETRRVEKISHAANTSRRDLPTPDQLLQRVEQAEKLNDTVERLSEPYRIVVRYRVWENAEFSQIAEVLEISEASVRTRWNRAVAQLREMLSQEPDGWEGVCRAVLGLPMVSALPAIAGPPSSSGLAVRSTARRPSQLMVPRWAGWPWVVLPVLVAGVWLGISMVPDHPVDAGSESAATSTRHPTQNSSASKPVRADEVDFHSARIAVEPGVSNRGNGTAESEPPRRIPIRILTMNGEPFMRELREQIGEASETLAPVIMFSAEPFSELDPLDRNSYSRAADADYHSRYLEQLEGLPENFDGYLDLQAPLPGHIAALCGNEVLGTGFIDSETPQVEIRVSLPRLIQSLGSLKFQLVDHVTRLPIHSGLRISLGRIDTARRESLAEQGLFERSHLMPGYYRLAIESEANRYHREQRWIAIEPGFPTDLGRIELRPSRRISGRVLDEQGQPIPGIRMACLPLNEIMRSGRVDGWSSKSVSNVDGSYVISDAGPGTQVVFPLLPKSWGAQAMLVEQMGQVVEHVDMTLHRASSLSIEAGWDALKYRLVRVVPKSKEVPVWSLGMLGGEAARAHLAPGEYRFEIVDRLGQVRAREVRVQVGESNRRLVLSE